MCVLELRKTKSWGLKMQELLLSEKANKAVRESVKPATSKEVNGLTSANTCRLSYFDSDMRLLKIAVRVLMGRKADEGQKGLFLGLTVAGKLF